MEGQRTAVQKGTANVVTTGEALLGRSRHGILGEELEIHKGVEETANNSSNHATDDQVVAGTNAHREMDLVIELATPPIWVTDLRLVQASVHSTLCSVIGCTYP